MSDYVYLLGKHCSQFVKKGGPKLLVNAMHRHSDNKQFMQSILPMFEQLTKKGIANVYYQLWNSCLLLHSYHTDKRLPLMIRLEGGLVDIGLSLTRYIDDTQYLQTACKTLTFFCAKYGRNINTILLLIPIFLFAANNAALMVKEHGLPNTLCLLRIHRDKEAVVQCTLELLACLCRTGTTHEK